MEPVATSSIQSRGARVSIPSIVFGLLVGGLLLFLALVFLSGRASAAEPAANSGAGSSVAPTTAAVGQIVGPVTAVAAPVTTAVGQVASPSPPPSVRSPYPSPPPSVRSPHPSPPPSVRSHHPSPPPSVRSPTRSPPPSVRSPHPSPPPLVRWLRPSVQRRRLHALSVRSPRPSPQSSVRKWIRSPPRLGRPDRGPRSPCRSSQQLRPLSRWGWAWPVLLRTGLAQCLTSRLEGPVPPPFQIALHQQMVPRVPFLQRPALARPAPDFRRVRPRGEPREARKVKLTPLARRVLGLRCPSGLRLAETAVQGFPWAVRLPCLFRAPAELRARHLPDPDRRHPPLWQPIHRLLPTGLKVSDKTPAFPCLNH